MKEVLGVKLSRGVIEAEKTIIPPVPQGHSLVKVRELMITPLNILHQHEKPLVGILHGSDIDSGKEVISTGVCNEHGFYNNEFLGWSLTPYPSCGLYSPPESLEDKVLYPLLSIVQDAVDNLEGEVLVVSKGGLLYSLFESAVTMKYRLYSGIGSTHLKKEPLISIDKLKGSSWDTVLVLTIHRALITDVFSLIGDAGKILYTPINRCISNQLYTNCSSCIVKILSTKKVLENDWIRKIDKHTLSKHIDRINVSYLPLEVSKPYIILEFKD